MAEYDGSIRIGVKVDEKNAEKQLEILKKRLQSQTLEIDKQAKAAGKLGAKLKEMAQKTGKPEFVEELVTGIAEAEAKAAELDRQIKEMNAAEPGGISAENAQKMQELIQQLAEADAKSDQLKASLAELGLKPTLADNLMRTAQDMVTAQQNIDRLKEAIRQTNEQLSQTQNDASGASEALRDIGESAKVSNQHIIDLREDLEELNQRKQDLEAAGVGLGFQEYDNTVAKIQEITNELKKYEARVKNPAIGAVESYAKLRSELEATIEAQNRLGLALGAGEQFNELDSQINNITQDLNDCRDALDRAAQNGSLWNVSGGAEAAQSRVKELIIALEDLQAKQKSVGYGEEFDAIGSQIEATIELLKSYGYEFDEVEKKSTSWAEMLEPVLNNLKSIMGKVKDVMVSAAKKAGNSVKNLGKHITELGKNRGFEKAHKNASLLTKLEKPLARFGQMIRRVFVFSVITSGLRTLKDQIEKYLSVNTQFMDALDRVKSNLLTAFQPIYEAVMPALTKLMETLEVVSAKFASFIAMIFGTTASQAQQNAKDLYEQANAEKAVGDAAEDAEKQQKKFLASFDTIEKVGEEKTETKQEKATDEQKDKLKFDTNFEEIQPPQWLIDFWKVFQDSWNQYGEATIEAFKFAMEGLKAAALALGEAFMTVWTDGTGLAFLNQIQLLLQQIFYLIGSIGQTFAQVWSSGAGVAILTELFNLLTTMLAIMTSMAASFNEVWTSGSGEAVLTALFALLATILGIIGDIASAFLEAWDSGAGTAAISAIMFAITAVLTLLNSVGQAFRDAWNDNRLGVQIFQTILSIITGIFNIVGELANRFKEAWEANGNGQAIMSAILTIIETILQTIDNIVQKTVEWAQGLNLEPLVSSVKDLLESLNPVIQIIGDTIAGIWQDTVLPFLSWLIEEALPNVLGVLTDLFQWMSENQEVVQFLTEAVIAFVAACAFMPIIGMITNMVAAFDPMTLAIKAVIAVIVLLIANWETVQKTVENVINAIIGFIENAKKAVEDFFSSLSGNKKSGTSGSFGGNAGGRSYSAQTYSAAPMTYNVGGETPNAAMRLLSNPEFVTMSASPRMARGVETTPNSEYVASGAGNGNNSGGISMAELEQALANVMSRQGGGNTKVDVNFTGSLAQLARVLQPEISVETQRLGPDLVGV